MPSLITQDHEFQMSPDEYGTLVSSFLSRLNFEMPSSHVDPAIAPALSSYIDEQPWPDSLKTRARKIAHGPASGIASWYPRAPFHHQFRCVVFTLLIVIYDEDFSTCGGGHSEFTAKLIRGESQETPFLDSFAQFLHNVGSFMGPYAASMMVKTTIEFVEATNLETEIGRTPRGAKGFPRYLRAKTGYTEPYAHAIFPDSILPESEWRNLYLPALPCLLDIIDFTNDILSLYKETIRGSEQINFLCNKAAAENTSLSEALQHTVDLVVARTVEMRDLLGPHPVLLRHVEDFLTGYIAWHLRNTKRYFLNEVDILNESRWFEIEPKLLPTRRS